MKSAHLIVAIHPSAAAAASEVLAPVVVVACLDFHHSVVLLDYYPDFPAVFEVCSFVDCPAACQQNYSDYLFAVAGFRLQVAAFVVVFVPAPFLFVFVVESDVSFLPSPKFVN